MVLSTLLQSSGLAELVGQKVRRELELRGVLPHTPHYAELYERSTVGVLRTILAERKATLAALQEELHDIEPVDEFWVRIGCIGTGVTVFIVLSWLFRK